MLSGSINISLRSSAGSFQCVRCQAIFFEWVWLCHFKFKILSSNFLNRLPFRLFHRVFFETWRPALSIDVRLKALNWQLICLFPTFPWSSAYRLPWNSMVLSLEFWCFSRLIYDVVNSMHLRCFVLVPNLLRLTFQFESLCTVRLVFIIASHTHIICIAVFAVICYSVIRASRQHFNNQ